MYRVGVLLGNTMVPPRPSLGISLSHNVQDLEFKQQYSKFYYGFCKYLQVRPRLASCSFVGVVVCCCARSSSRPSSRTSRRGEVTNKLHLERKDHGGQEGDHDQTRRG